MGCSFERVTAGRRTKYSQERVDKICQLIESDDYTMGEVCRQVGIHVDTFCHWRNTRVEFSERIKKAEEKRLETFKAAARSGLLTLLRGKELEEVTTEMTSDAEGKPRIKRQIKTKKFIQPNAVSVIFALKNLDPGNFADVIKQEHTGNPVVVFRIPENGREG